MKKLLFMFAILGASSSMYASQMHESKSAIVKDVGTPKYLYKILDYQLWQDSQKQQTLLLPKDDAEFVHFSKEDQLDRILTKYWANAPHYVVLTIDTDQITGKLVYEVNPGGASKYYHLYSGMIPLNAVVNVKEVQK